MPLSAVALYVEVILAGITSTQIATDSQRFITRTAGGFLQTWFPSDLTVVRVFISCAILLVSALSGCSPYSLLPSLDIGLEKAHQYHSIQRGKYHDQVVSAPAKQKKIQLLVISQHLQYSVLRLITKKPLDNMFTLGTTSTPHCTYC